MTVENVHGQFPQKDIAGPGGDRSQPPDYQADAYPTEPIQAGADVGSSYELYGRRNRLVFKEI